VAANGAKTAMPISNTIAALTAKYVSRRVGDASINETCGNSVLFCELMATLRIGGLLAKGALENSGALR
jgi:hypothetical protein